MDNFKLLYQEIDQRLQTLDPIIRSKVIIQTKQELENIQSENSQLNESQVIRNWIEGDNLNRKLLALLKPYNIYEIPLPKRSVLKTFILSAAIVVICFFILIGLAFTFMTPVLEFNEKGISLLGGSFQISNVKMDIATNNNSFRINKTNIKHHKQGQVKLKAAKDFEISIGPGHLILTNSPSDELIWECIKSVEHTYNNKKLILDPGENNDCHIHLPQNINYKFEFEQGLVQIENPKYNLSLKMNQGQVQLKPDELTTYDFDLKVLNGVAEVFEGQKQDFDYQIKINVNDGMISHSY